MLNISRHEPCIARDSTRSLKPLSTTFGFLKGGMFMLNAFPKNRGLRTAPLQQCSRPNRGMLKRAKRRPDICYDASKLMRHPV